MHVPAQKAGFERDIAGVGSIVGCLTHSTPTETLCPLGNQKFSDRGYFSTLGLDPSSSSRAIDGYLGLNYGAVVTAYVQYTILDWVMGLMVVTPVHTNDPTK